MAPAFAGQLSPVRLLGWQRLLRLKMWCPCRRRVGQSRRHPGILSPVCSVLAPYGGGGIGRSAILLECLAVCSPSNSSLCVSPHTPTTYAPTRLRHTLTETNTLTQMDLHTQAHSSMLLWSVHSYTCEHTLAHALCVSLCLTHIPCLSICCEGQVTCCLYSFPVFVSSSCSSLRSLFHSKQNKMKSNTDLI